MGKQSQRQDFGDSKGRYGGSQSEANTHDVMEQSEASTRDGGQRKMGLAATDGSMCSNAQANNSIQKLSRGEGNEFGYVGISMELVSREGKDKGDDGMDEVEFVEGSRDFASSG